MTRKTYRITNWLAMIVVMAALCHTAPALSASDQQSYDKAMKQYNWGEHEEALAVFEAFSTNYPTSALIDDAQYMMGECYVRLDRRDDAIFALYTAAYKYPKGDRRDDALMALAGVLHTQGHSSQVLKTYERLAKDHPNSPHAAYAQTSVGWLHGSKGDTKKAKIALAQVVRDYPNSPYAQTAKQSIKHIGGPAPVIPPPPPPPTAPPPPTVISPSTPPMPVIAPPTPPMPVIPPPPPPVISQPPPAPTSSSKTLSVAAGETFVIRTPTKKGSELFIGDDADPTKARIHLRLEPSGAVAMRFEGRWVAVGARDAYGRKIKLKSTMREKNRVVWTFTHSLAPGTRTSAYLITDKTASLITQIISTP
jgi:TolA-binding protein